MEPLVSVVIAAYNSAGVIGQTLESVLSQTWPRLEVLVLDDGSTDGTEAAVRAFGDRVRYLWQANAGLAAARNAAMAAARGDLVAWLDSDDLFLPSKLALQVAVLQRHPECVIVGTDFSAFDAARGVFERSHAAGYYGAIGRTPGGLAAVYPHREDLSTAGLPHLGGDLPAQIPVYWGALGRRLAFGNVLHPPTVLVRRDVAARAGPLDPRFRRDSDWEWFLRVAALGEVAYLDHPLLHYRYSPGQMSSDRHLADIARSRLLVLERLSEDPSLSGDPAFRRRLGVAHLALANAVADTDRAEGARHLLRSLRHGHAGPVTLRAAAKLVLPRRVTAALRKRPPEAP